MDISKAELKELRKTAEKAFKKVEKSLKEEPSIGHRSIWTKRRLLKNGI